MAFNCWTTCGNPLQGTLLTVVLVCLAVAPSPLRGADPSPLERAFKAQILVDLDAQATVSPGAQEAEEWPADPRWNVNDKVATVFILVQVSPALVDAAVEYWAENHPNITDAKKEAAAVKLRNQYMRNDERAFLLLVKPIEGAAYPDEWRIKIGPLKDNVQLITLDGEVGKVVRAEPRLDGILDGTSGIETCVFWVSYNVPAVDGVFNVRLSNMYYYIKHSGRFAKGKKREWLQARSAETVFFRYATGEVSILSMIQDGVPWEEIERTYLQTKLRFAGASSYGGVAKFIADVAFDLVVGLLLKAI